MIKKWDPTRKCTNDWDLTIKITGVYNQSEFVLENENMKFSWNSEIILSRPDHQILVIITPPPRKFNDHPICAS